MNMSYTSHLPPVCSCQYHMLTSAAPNIDVFGDFCVSLCLCEVPGCGGSHLTCGCLWHHVETLHVYLLFHLCHAHDLLISWTNLSVVRVVVHTSTKGAVALAYSCRWCQWKQPWSWMLKFSGVTHRSPTRMLTDLSLTPLPLHASPVPDWVWVLRSFVGYSRDCSGS